MNDHHRAQPGADAGISSVSPESKAARRKCCAHCGGPFGLVRRRRGGTQFCSAACMEKHTEAFGKALRERVRWHAFLKHSGRPV